MKKLSLIAATALLLMSCAKSENSSDYSERENVYDMQVAVADEETQEEAPVIEAEGVAEKIEADAPPAKEESTNSNIGTNTTKPVKPAPATKPTPAPKPAPENPPVQPEKEVPGTNINVPKEELNARGGDIKIDVKGGLPTTLPEGFGENRPKIEEITQRVKEQVLDEAPSHAAFDALLKKHVSKSRGVNYAGLKKDAAELEKYLNKLMSVTDEKSWSRNERLAYWINLYNAATLKLILDHYPIATIKGINSGKPWDKKWIKAGGKTYSLNDIENSVIRPQFKDARIHFALNCAAKSCPPLANKAYTAQNLETMLEENTKAFINSDSNIAAGKAEVSSIFDWYAADFGDVRAFINKYATTKIDDKTKITFSTYDWKLNKQ